MQVDAGRNITLVGTAHISKKSIKDVKQAIREKKPKVVAVELDEARYTAITKKKRWQKTSIFKILKEGKIFIVLAQIVLSMLQRQLSKEGIKPGSEMIAAIKYAKRKGYEIALVDRDITVTMKRAWANMGLWEKLKLFYFFIYAILDLDRFSDEVDEEQIEQMTEDQDLITTMMEELRSVAPGATKTLIDERDAYLAQKILDASEKGPVVGVIGAGHMKGVLKYIKNPEMIPKLKELEVVPEKKINVFKAIAWLLPIFFIGMLVFGLVNAVVFGDWGKLAQLVGIWLVLNAVCAFIGGILAGGHPLTWIVGAVASPITSLNPLIGAGWVAGYVEALLRRPTVKDIEDLQKITKLREFYKNRFVKVLLVASFVNIGSSVGAISAWILMIFSWFT